MEAILFAIGAGALAYVGVMLFLPKKEDKHTREALNELYRDTQNTLEAAQGGAISSLTKHDFSDLAPWAKYIYQLPFMRGLYSKILQAGYLKSAEMFLFYLFLGIFVLVIILSQLLPGILGLPCAFIAGYFIFSSVVKRMVKRRSQQFLEQFPDVLDMIVRSVRSGFPLPTALQLVAENMEDPVKTEFATVVEEIAMGRSMTEVISRLAKRIDEQDIDFFAVILMVQQETGGNLSEVLSNLSDVIRKRKQLRNKVKAITAEGRMTAWIMGGLPIALFLVMNTMQPEYMAPFFDSMLGFTFLGGAAALVFGCIFVIYKLVDIDI